MKSKLTILLILILMLGLMPINFSSAAGLATKLKGKILLQVESNGEAWYVNPENEKRYYLGRPADAFQVMRELGLGISNKDFNSFNGYVPSRLSGKILLKVEDSGKAYYANPDDLKMYYLGRPDDAFQIMRKLGLGITNNDLNTIEAKFTGETLKTNYYNKTDYSDLFGAIVKIECHNSNNTVAQQGTGVIINPEGFIITNNHVVETFILGGEICRGGIITKPNSYEPDYFFDIDFTSKEPANDIAYGVINDENKKVFPYIPIEHNVTVGEDVSTLGYPDIANGSINLSKGIISSKTKIGDIDYILTDAGASYGNSGGALINSSGKLIGIPTSVEASDLSSLTYAIDIDVLYNSISLNTKLKNSMPDEYKYLYQNINNWILATLLLK